MSTAYKMTEIAGIRCRIAGSDGDVPLLIWAAGGHEQDSFEKVFEKTAVSGIPFQLISFEVSDWNRELSPWYAPPVFGNEPFSGEGAQTLDRLRDSLIPQLSAGRTSPIFIGGYSLAGLFSLWALYQTPALTGAAACSASLWFPDWDSFSEHRTLPANKLLYLSLGDREEHTRNRILCRVGDAVRAQYARSVEALGTNRCTLEWNPGGHFNDPEGRLAKGFAWLLEHSAS